MSYIIMPKVFPYYHSRSGDKTSFKERILSGTMTMTVRLSAAAIISGEVISIMEWAGPEYKSARTEFAHCKICVEKLVLEDAVCGTITKLALDAGFDSVQDFASWFRIRNEGTICFDGYKVRFKEVYKID